MDGTIRMLWHASTMMTKTGSHMCNRLTIIAINHLNLDWNVISSSCCLFISCFTLQVRWLIVTGCHVRTVFTRINSSMQWPTFWPQCILLAYKSPLECPTVHGANMGPIWGHRTKVGPMLAPWTLLSGVVKNYWFLMILQVEWMIKMQTYLKLSKCHDTEIWVNVYMCAYDLLNNSTEDCADTLVVVWQNYD